MLPHPKDKKEGYSTKENVFFQTQGEPKNFQNMEAKEPSQIKHQELRIQPFCKSIDLTA